MAIQTINIGNIVNDGLGDDLRTAFQKVNANFSEINSTLTVTASNVGLTGVGIFKEKVGSDLQFKKLVPGSKMFLEEFTDSIVITNQQPDSFVRIDTNNGVVLGNDFINLSLGGGNAGRDIQTSVVDNVISINTVLPITSILSNLDFGPITGEYEYTTQLALASANIDFGTISNPGTINLDLGVI